MSAILPLGIFKQETERRYVLFTRISLIFHSLFPQHLQYARNANDDIIDVSKSTSLMKERFPSFDKHFDLLVGYLYVELPLVVALY